MSELATINQLVELTKRSEDYVKAAIRRQKVEPVHTLKLGRGTTPLYDPAVVVAAFERDAAEKAKEQAENQRKAATVAGAAKPDDRALASLLDLAQKSVHSMDCLVQEASDHGEVTEQLTQAVAQIAEQNRIMFRCLSELKSDVTCRLDDLATVLRTAAGAPAPAPGAGAPAVVDGPPAASIPLTNTAGDEPRDRKPRVAVLGLLTPQQRLIEQEFSKSFDMRIYEGRECNGRAFESAIANCDHAFFMTSFNAHSTEEVLRKAGVTYTRVNGGLSRLREHLRELFKKLNESTKEAAHG